jgi:hypothetical protein
MQASFSQSVLWEVAKQSNSLCVFLFPPPYKPIVLEILATRFKRLLERNNITVFFRPVKLPIEFPGKFMKDAITYNHHGWPAFPVLFKPKREYKSVRSALDPSFGPIDKQLERLEEESSGSFDHENYFITRRPNITYGCMAEAILSFASQDYTGLQPCDCSRDTPGRGLRSFPWLYVVSIFREPYAWCVLAAGKTLNGRFYLLVTNVDPLSKSHGKIAIVWFPSDRFETKIVDNVFEYFKRHSHLF